MALVPDPFMPRSLLGCHSDTDTTATTLALKKKHTQRKKNPPIIALKPTGRHRRFLAFSDPPTPTRDWLPLEARGAIPWDLWTVQRCINLWPTDDTASARLGIFWISSNWEGAKARRGKHGTGVVVDPTALPSFSQLVAQRARVVF